MYKFKLYFLLFISLILLTNCNKEEPYESPLIQTGEVTNIDTEGATFHGKILGLGNKPVLDYGFVWDNEPGPTINGSYIKSFGSANNPGVFDATITSAFIEGNSYYVKAFIRDEETNIYGREVIFMSQGSKLPFITSYSPDSATWGDTIRITGGNFSTKMIENHIEFNRAKARVVFASETEIKAIVPNDLFDSSSMISLSFQEKTTFANKNFKLILHVITSFTPENGTRGDEITISGQYFSPVIQNNSVLIGNTLAKLIYATPTSLTAKIPESVFHGKQLICVDIAGRKVTSTDDFMIYEPFYQISSFGSKSKAFCFSINGKAYVGGGDASRTLFEYNPITNTWTQKVNIPKSDIIGYAIASTSSYGYVILHKVLYQYNPVLDEWKQKTFPGIGEWRQIAFSINEKIYVGLGTGTSGYTTEFWEYDEISEIWTKKAEFPFGNKIDAIGFSINDKGYVLLGNPSNEYIYEYDSNTDQWKEKLNIGGIVQDLSDNRISSAAFVIEGKGYFTCGASQYNGGRVKKIFKDLYQFDPLENSCKRLIDLPSNERYQHIAFSIHNIGYIGLGHYGSNYSDIWEFDPSKLKP
jgi:hypothetical protein